MCITLYREVVIPSFSSWDRRYSIDPLLNFKKNEAPRRFRLFSISGLTVSPMLKDALSLSLSLSLTHTHTHTLFTHSVIYMCINYVLRIDLLESI